MYPNQIFTGAVDLWKSFVYGDTNFVRASKWDSYYGNNAELPHADIQAIIPFREKIMKSLLLAQMVVYFSQEILLKHLEI